MAPAHPHATGVAVYPALFDSKVLLTLYDTFYSYQEQTPMICIGQYVAFYAILQPNNLLSSLLLSPF